jgi:hypothetical protein
MSTLIHLPRFSFGGPLAMMYKLLRDYFVLNDSMNSFDFFFEVCGYIVQNHVPPLVSHLLLCILTPNISRHMSHHDRCGNLSFNCLHTDYLI